MSISKYLQRHLLHTVNLKCKNVQYLKILFNTFFDVAKLCIYTFFCIKNQNHSLVFIF